MRVQRYPGLLWLQFGYIPPRQGGAVPLGRWHLRIALKARRPFVSWFWIGRKAWP